MEITLPTKPLETFDDPNGLISLCTLSAINWGKIKKPEQFEKSCKLAVYSLDALLDYQEYPLQAAKNSTEWYRPLGIGVNDLAHFLAKRGLKYDASALPVVDEYKEAMAFYLTKASVELAKRYGACGKVEHTKYSQGVVPCDVRKVEIDDLVPHVERMDWDSLRNDMKQYGIRNATLMACMPSETSSRVQNLTNGVEPIRDLITVKDGISNVAPEAEKLKGKYVSAWDVNTEDYLKIMAVLQKWIDQSISANTTYDPSKFEGGMIPGSLVLRHLLIGYKYGIKTFYYHNNVKNDAIGTQDGEVCESCVL